MSDIVYKSDEIYWFKYEPIEWNVLKETENSLLICSNSIIDYKRFNPVPRNSLIHHNGLKGYINDYSLSDIRKWLNDDFYNFHFFDNERKKIVSYDLNGNYDKIFILSRDEFIEYSNEIKGSKKTLSSSDYAHFYNSVIRGTDKNTFFLRTPYTINYVYTNDEHFVYIIDYDYKISHVFPLAFHGVKPALKINLE